MVDEAVRTEAVTIGDRTVGRDAPPYLVAEIGQAHDGSVGIAHSYIDALAAAGADAVKFQTHIAEAESTLDEPFRVAFSAQDETRYDYWRRMQFTPSEWTGLAEHARGLGLEFLSSPFSLAAVELLISLQVPAWKVGSGEAWSGELLDAMVETGKPIILSTGMSSLAEVERTVTDLRSRGAPVIVLQCTSKYPSQLEDVGLNVLEELRLRLGCPVGLSDHTGVLWPAVAALARGACLIETHVVFDRRMFGPDAPASLTVDEFSRLVQARDAIWTLDQNPVDKDAMARELARTRELFTKSLVVSQDLPAGTLLTAELLTSKKPGTGIPASELHSVVGRRLRRDVRSNRLLQPEDLYD